MKVRKILKNYYKFNDNNQLSTITMVFNKLMYIFIAITTFMENTLLYSIHGEICYSEIFSNSYILPSLKYFTSTK